MYKELKKSSDDEYWECKEAAGRTVQTIVIDTYDSGQAIISFTDETFVVLDVYVEYHGKDWGVARDYRTCLKNHGWHSELLLESGIITEEELKEKRHERADRERSRVLHKDRKEWARLKAKYDW